MPAVQAAEPFGADFRRPMVDRKTPVHRAIRILELRSVRGTGGGPDKTILLGAAQSDPKRCAVTVCYLRDARDTQFGLDKRASQLGVDYVEVIERHSFDWKVWSQLRRLIRDREFDIIHAHDYKTDLLALCLARAEGVVPLATSHGWIVNSLRERFYRSMDRRILARYPLVIAVSEPIRQALISSGARPDRVRRIRNGIDASYFRREPGARPRVRVSLGIHPDAVVLGAVGRLEKEKRFDLLLETAVRLRTVARPVIVLVGEGSCRRALTEQARSLNLGDCVRLLGHREDVREIYHCFDVYVQSSDTEGNPNAVLEAMAMKIPVVATDVGGTSDLIEHEITGLLAPRRLPDRLAHAIDRALSDPHGTALRVAAARQRVEGELSFRARACAIERIYQELMSNPGAKRSGNRVEQRSISVDRS
jgi:glycosyltransferase involved in cell wall biosynthesis